MSAAMEVRLCRETGSAEMCKGTWSMRVGIDDLPKWLQIYRGFWSRGSKVKNGPGPWAKHFEEDLRAIEAAIREAGNVG